MKIKNVVMYQLDGETPAPANETISGKDNVLTLARVLINACLSPDTQGGMRPISAENSVARYDLALTLYKTAVDQFFDVKNEVIQGLYNDVLRLYAPMISGPVIKMIEAAKADGVSES